MDTTLLEVSEGPSFSKLNLSVIHLSFLSIWNKVMVSDFKILGRKIRKGNGKWKKKRKKWRDREMNEVREKLGFSVPIILRSNNLPAFRHLGRRNTDFKTKLWTFHRCFTVLSIMLLRQACSTLRMGLLRRSMATAGRRPDTPQKMVSLRLT